MKLDEEKLEAQMEYARYEQETEILRERKYLPKAKIVGPILCYTISIYTINHLMLCTAAVFDGQTWFTNRFFLLLTIAYFLVSGKMLS